ncbi:MAG: leucine-rich repeat domain-containing protein [Bacteroidales bacterium]|nr:leucine-rich repeat domain-containing protein [Bacteroidales bacterium]
MVKRLLIALLCACAGSLVWAHDFSVPMQGYSLYYNILNSSADEIEVASPNDKGITRWQGFTEPSGKLVIPEEVEYRGVTYKVVAIGERAFAGCGKITSVSLPTSLKSIGAYAFVQCTGLKGSIVIGEAVESIGNSAFFGCGITEVEFNAEACDEMGDANGNAVFGNCNALKRVTFGADVKRIPAYAFAGLDNLKIPWELPAKLEYIGDYAFSYCSAIYGDLYIPDGVRKIGEHAFTHCHLIKSLILPEHLDAIGARAFMQCINIKEITVNALTPPEMGDDVFIGLKTNVRINVPCISVDRYNQHQTWKYFKNVTTFPPCAYNVSAQTSPQQCGMVIGGGDYKYGDSATLIAVCYAGYGFRQWTDGNRDNPRQIHVTDTATYTAVMQPADIMHEVEYKHDTVWAEGAEIVREYYEINDVAEPIYTQEAVSYNGNKHRIELEIDKDELVEVSLYNEAGLCVQTGKPRRGHISMRRRPTGYYIVRVSTIDDERVLRFFHDKNK